MELVKTYRIREVHGTNFSSAPYKFLLESADDYFIKEVGELVLDKGACERHNIVPSLDLVGRKLKCTLIPRVLRDSKRGGEPLNDENWPGRDDVMIDHFKREERWESIRWCIGELEKEISYSLVVYSDDGTDGI
jgi:hypothetical protein